MNLDSSQEIIERAISEHNPYAIVAMLSGGKDSMAAYQAAKRLDVKLTHMLHGVTGTGIPETTEFVRDFAATTGLAYLEANAGDSYEQYVRRKGFFGRGMTAHSYAYHILKRQRFTHTISTFIRQRRRNRPVLLINGARVDESLNRSKNLVEPIRSDPSIASNVWVNIIHDWTKQERDEFLLETDAPTNPVTQKLCRSGECLCGTMQNYADREEASFYFPHWGAWLDNLEREVMCDFPWRWGEAVTQQSRAQMSLFQPMCNSCLTASEEP